MPPMIDLRFNNFDVERVASLFTISLERSRLGLPFPRTIIDFLLVNNFNYRDYLNNVNACLTCLIDEFNNTPNELKLITLIGFYDYCKGDFSKYYHIYNNFYTDTKYFFDLLHITRENHDVIVKHLRNMNFNKEDSVQKYVICNSMYYAAVFIMEIIKNDD